jgi:hypothetical protein
LIQLGVWAVGAKETSLLVDRLTNHWPNTTRFAAKSERKSGRSENRGRIGARIKIFLIAAIITVAAINEDGLAPVHQFESNALILLIIFLPVTNIIPLAV